MLDNHPLNDQYELRVPFPSVSDVNLNTHLCIIGSLASLVLRDLMYGMLLTFLALAKGLALLGNADHSSY